MHKNTLKSYLQCGDHGLSCFACLSLWCSRFAVNRLWRIVMLLGFMSLYSQGHTMATVGLGRNREVQSQLCHKNAKKKGWKASIALINNLIFSHVSPFKEGSEYGKQLAESSDVTSYVTERMVWGNFHELLLQTLYVWQRSNPTSEQFKSSSDWASSLGKPLFLVA